MGLRHIMISAVTQLRLIGQLRLAGASGSARPAVRCLGFTSSPEGCYPTANRCFAPIRVEFNPPALAATPPAHARPLLDSRSSPFKTHNCGMRPAA